MGTINFKVEEVIERFFVDGQLAQERVMRRRVYRPAGEPPFIGDPERRRPLTTDDPPVVAEARTQLAFDAASWAQVQSNKLPRRLEHPHTRSPPPPMEQPTRRDCRSTLSPGRTFARDTGPVDAAVVPARAPRQGPRRRSRRHHSPGPPRDGVRRAGGLAGHHRAVHDDPRADRLRPVRPVADPRPRTGLVPRSDDRRDPRSARGRRRKPEDRRRLRLRACSHGRRDHRARRRVQARLRRRPALEADPDRVHERPRAHHPRQPATQAVRVLRRRRRVDR